MPVHAVLALDAYANQRRDAEVACNFFGEEVFGEDFLAWDIVCVSIILELDNR